MNLLVAILASACKLELSVSVRLLNLRLLQLALESCAQLAAGWELGCLQQACRMQGHVFKRCFIGSFCWVINLSAGLLVCVH